MKSPHYAWVVAFVTFAVLLITAAFERLQASFWYRSRARFGWSRTVISGPVAINIALFGLIGPFAASVMDRWGLKRVVLCAIALLALSVAMSTQMRTDWQLVLCWGVLVGAGTGVTSMVLAAVVATRWFDERRGVVLGALSAANATGQLVFLPSLASVIETSGWRTAAFVVAGAAGIVFVLVLLFMRDRPEDIGLRPYGQRHDGATAATPRPMAPLAALTHGGASGAPGRVTRIASGIRKPCVSGVERSQYLRVSGGTTPADAGSRTIQL